MKAKPSLLLIAHTYAIAEHAKKLPELSRWFDVTCATVRSRELDGHYGLKGETFRGEAEVDSVTMARLPAHGSVASVTRFVLRGLGTLIHSRDWDYVLAETEPWSWLKWQALLACRIGGRVRHYGEFTWENVRRPGLKGWILEKVYALSARWLDFWICGSQAAGAIVRQAGMPPDRVFVCPQVGVDITNRPKFDKTSRRCLRRERNIPADAFVAGFAGRLVEEKGIFDLVEAVEAINDSHPAGGHPAVHLALMGHGILRPRLERLALSRSWLHLYPAVPHHEVPEFLASLDALVLGSHPVFGPDTCWEEQFGHILIEAIACGAVCLGSSSGAIPEVLADDEVIFAPGDRTRIAQLIRRLADDTAWRDLKRHRQWERVTAHYTHAAVADTLARGLLAMEAAAADSRWRRPLEDLKIS